MYMVLINQINIISNIFRGLLYFIYKIFMYYLITFNISIILYFFKTIIFKKNFHVALSLGKYNSSFFSKNNQKNIF